MTVFLAAGPTTSDVVPVQQILSPSEILRAGGLVSPIFPAFAPGPPSLPGEGSIVLLYTNSPRRLLTTAQEQLGQDLKSALFLTYGLPAIGAILPSIVTPESLLDPLDQDITGFEIWPLRANSVTMSEIHRTEPTPSHSFPIPDDISDAGLPFDAAAQVRQFNANIASFVHYGTRYAPEYAQLVSWLELNVRRVSDSIRDTLSEPDNPNKLQLRNDSTVTLVELNAGLAMLFSQLFSGVQPLLRQDFCVPEYGLFGIGITVRALWRYYKHINDFFHEANHQTAMQQFYEVGSPFPIFRNKQRLDFKLWERSPIGFTSLSPPRQSAAARAHVLYFSSRYGFHESLNTMSASWQCVHSSATRDFNLLTLSHEYLHAQVRGLLAIILDRFTPIQLHDILQRDRPDTAWESFAGAIVRALHFCARARADLGLISPTQPAAVSPGWNSVPSEAQIISLLEGPMRRYLQEMVVHSLDYLYMYDARDDLYVQSIWGSWTFVPAVIKRLHHYLLRTIVALSCRSAVALPELVAYRDAVDRLCPIYDAILSAHNNPVIAAARGALTSPDAVPRLQLEFTEAYYISRLARTFFFDQKLARQLQRDPATFVANNAPTYGLTAGTIPDKTIESPSEFLLDRFSSYPYDGVDPDRASESLWQLLLLVEPTEHSTP